MSSPGFSMASEALEDEWQKSDYTRSVKTRSTVASRIDSDIAAKLDAFVRGKGDLS